MEHAYAPQAHTENCFGERVTATGVDVEGTFQRSRLKVVLGQENFDFVTQHCSYSDIFVGERS